MAEAYHLESPTAVTLADALPSDPAAAAETRARAATTVDRFVREVGLAGLDAALAAAHSGDTAGAHAGAQRTAEAGRLLDAEVARFRSLRPQG
jgi:hypothetical protein